MKSIDSAVAVMLAQRDKGIRKYGQSIEDAGLSAAELIQHAREEMADGSVYLAQLAAQHETELKRAYARGMDALWNALLANGFYAAELYQELRGAEVPMPLRGYVQPTLADAFTAGKVNLMQVSRIKTHPFTQPIEVLK